MKKDSLLLDLYRKPWLKNAVPTAVHRAAVNAVLRFRQRGRDRVKIPFMVVITGQKCTLRCANCANFTPYLPQTFYDFGDIKADLEKINEVADINLLQLQGGESLVYPWLADLLKLVTTLNIDKVQIASNGIAPIKPELLNTLKRSGVTVRISNYGVTRKKSTAAKAFTKSGVPFYEYDFAFKTDKWVDLGGKDFPRESDNRVVEKRFLSCPFRSCLTLENGVVAKCSRGTVAHHIQKFEPQEGDHVEVRSGSNLAASLREYVTNTQFMEACRHCAGINGEKIKPAIQLSMNP